MQELYCIHRRDNDGSVASHLPELANADPDWFGLCAVTENNEILEAGDSRLAFTAQSIAKLLILALALADHGPETILAKIGVEPTGERFDSMLYSGDQKQYKLNPFMNAGALVALDMLAGDGIDTRFSRITELLYRMLGRPIMLDQQALNSRRQQDHHNRALAYLLLSRGMIKGPVDEILELYHRLCSILLDCRDLARIAAVLANTGVQPGSRQRIMSDDQVKTLLSVMQTCGLYDFSGQWAYRVGLPAKSSLCGAILVVVPGHFGFAVYSPPLNEVHQKSVRGVKVCEALSRQLSLHMFRPDASKVLPTCIAPVRQANVSHQAYDINCLLARIHAAGKDDAEGHVYNIAPDYLRIDPDAYSISITTIDGQRYRVGDHDAAFLIQSISKIFAYGMALEDQGRETVLQNIDVEPTGNPYDAIIRLEQRSKRPHNPMVNTGGIATTAMIKGDGRAHRLDRVLAMYQRYIGRDIEIDMHSYHEEIKLGDRNKAIAYLLRHFGMLETEVDAALSLYLLQCSALVNSDDLSTMAATLANAGVNPLTGERAIAEEYVGDLLTVMYTCGMYDYAGEWSYRIGLPAKSGVGGGILAVVPGEMGIAVYSPKLNRHGNSIAGIKALEAVSANLNLHMFSCDRRPQYPS
ncbi:MAG: glutaminase A [Gammaproteobacteria bacterium]